MKQITKNLIHLLQVFCLVFMLTNCVLIDSKETSEYAFSIMAANLADESLPSNCYEGICAYELFSNSLKEIAGGSMGNITPYYINQEGRNEDGRGDMGTSLDFDGSDQYLKNISDIRFEYDKENDRIQLRPINGAKIYQLNMASIEEGIKCDLRKMEDKPILILESHQAYCVLSNDRNIVVFLSRIFGNQNEVWIDPYGYEHRMVGLKIDYKTWSLDGEDK